MNLPSMALIQQLEETLKDARPFNQDNIGKLEDLREQMLYSGFNAPFKGILQRTMEEAKDMEEAEWADLKKQVSYFKQIAGMKKYSLARASIALSAHRLSSHFLEMGYADIAEHTPLDGNHLAILMDSGAEGVLAYRTIMDRFDMMAEVSNCFQIKVKNKDETHTIQIDDKERIDYKVARMFGLDAVVTEVRPSMRRKPLVSSKGVRISLVSAIVNYISKSVEEELIEGEGGEVKKYNAFLRGKGIRPDVRMDQVDGYEETKEEMVKEGLLEKKDGGYSMGKELAKELDMRKKERRDKILNRSTMLLLAPILKFYLTTPREQRKKANLYPGMAVVPSNSHSRLFIFLYEADPELPAPTILRRKMEIEEMGVRVDHQKLAAAILLKESEKDSGWVAEYLGMEKEEVEKSPMLLESIEKEGRGGEFLKRVKKGK